MASESRKTVRTIVVAVDESEESMSALSWCLRNLATIGQSATTMFLLYVKPPPVIYSLLDFAGNYFGDDVVAAVEKYSGELGNSVMRRAEEIYKDFTTNIRVEKKVGTGEAKDVICSAVEELEADILVMGSHKYGFLKRAFLGSVSNHCTKHAKCPVVVVKHQRST